AVMRSSAPLFCLTAANRPTASTIPVNIAADPRPIMYQSPARAAPPESTAALRPAETPERLEKRGLPPRQAPRVPAPSTNGPRALPPTAWCRAPRPLHTTKIGSQPGAVG